MKYLFIFIYSIYLILRTKKSIHMLQQNFYNSSNRYWHWIFKNKTKSFLTIDILFFIPLCLGILINQIVICYIAFYFIILVYYYLQMKKEVVKIKLKITPRVKRMVITFSIIYIGILLLSNYINIIYAGIIIGLFATINNFIIYLVNIINKPVEKCVYLYYYNKAKRKIKDMPRLEVIGITGSYGKTSSKNILADILKVKFDTLPTPKNFNTPYGLMRTINDHLDKFTEYFIAEMGACNTGEIKKLCDFVHPKYGILTRIGVAHLETFKTEKNIQKTKFELIESLPIDGIGVLNMDDPKQREYKINNNCQIRWISIENKDADLIASNIKGSPSGMEFDVTWKEDQKTYHLETKLLGSANVYNIMAGVVLAKELGMSMEEIIRGVRGITPIEHRLEMKKLGNINIIDDAYNSNPVGAKMAVDTLSLMPGKKVIVTPGMIELKDKQYELNKIFGTQIAQVCDYVILVGKTQTKPIYEGLMEKGYSKEKIEVIDDVSLAFNIIRTMDANTYVLLENDLPDLFNE